MHALEINGLIKVYQGKKRQMVEAVTDLNLTVECGEVMGFLGPNGAGKSTTIKCLVGLIRPTGGTASIMGKDIALDEARNHVGYLPENPAFYDFLSAEEYLRFVGGVFGMSLHVLNERIEESLKLLELWDVRKRPVRSFSKGMVQRVGLAQVMIHDPDVYILDEPMSGLDPLGRALVKDIIIGLKKRGKSVFFSTHITDDVEKVCDRVAVINKGRLVAVDDVDNIMQRGIEGYCVTVVEKDGAVKDYYVGKSDLQEFILSSAADSKTIERIESRRKDMEAFFLEMVSR